MCEWNASARHIGSFSLAVLRRPFGRPGTVAILFCLPWSLINQLSQFQFDDEFGDLHCYEDVYFHNTGDDNCIRKLFFSFQEIMVGSMYQAEVPQSLSKYGPNGKGECLLNLVTSFLGTHLLFCVNILLIFFSLFFNSIWRWWPVVVAAFWPVARQSRSIPTRCCTSQRHWNGSCCYPPGMSPSG